MNLSWPFRGFFTPFVPSHSWPFTVPDRLHKRFQLFLKISRLWNRPQKRLWNVRRGTVTWTVWNDYKITFTLQKRKKHCIFVFNRANFSRFHQFSLFLKFLKVWLIRLVGESCGIHDCFLLWISLFGRRSLFFWWKFCQFVNDLPLLPTQLIYCPKWTQRTK